LLFLIKLYPISFIGAIQIYVFYPPDLLCYNNRMELRELIELYDRDQRIGSEDPRYRREESIGIVRQVPLMPDRLGFVAYSHLDEENADAVIRAQIDRFTVLGIDFEWKLYDHDTPPDLKERLHTAGFIIEEAESIMVLDLDQAPIELLYPAPTVKRNEAAHPMGRSPCLGCMDFLLFRQPVRQPVGRRHTELATW
jgi:hypothetical protein